MYGIKERRGFVALIGEAGTGKTTLLRAAMSTLDKNTRSAFVFNSDLPFIQLMALILDELGILGSVTKLSLIGAVRRLNDFAIKQFAKGGNVAIMVDEAQNFDAKTIDGLRLLSNLESGEHKLIQVILAGQPALEDKLSKRALRQFTQRISLRRTISPLVEKDVYEYIRYRLKKVGYDGPDLFSKNAMNMIWQHSEGIPRKINILCDNVLLNAYAMGDKKIKAAAVDEAVDDLTFGQHSSSGRKAGKSLRERLRVIQSKAAMF
jgi:general secretion pathway protein A